MKNRFTFRWLLVLFGMAVSGFVSAQTAPYGQRTVKNFHETPPSKVATARADAAGVTLYGCIINSYADGHYSEYSYWADYEPGVFSFSSVSSTPSFKSVRKSVKANGGGAYANGLYYVIECNDGGAAPTDIKLSVYDVDNDYAVKLKGKPVTYMASDLTYDPTTNQVFGCFSNDFSTWTLGTISESGDQQLIGTALPARMAALACSANGDLYGIRMDDGNIYYIDKVAGTVSLVGETGVSNLGFWQSATFDHESGMLYWTAFHNDFESSELYSITLDGNGSTAVVKGVNKVADFGPNGSYTSDQVTGLFIPYKAETASVPKPVENVEVSFHNAAIEGFVLFTMPTQDAAGGDLNGQLSYVVKVGDEPEVRGESTPGERVQQYVSVSANGEYAVSVTVTSDAGASMPVVVNKYIGMDGPTFVPFLNLAWAEESRTVTVSWQKPTGSLHGGYIDENNLTYTVVRMPDNVVVASRISELECEDVIESNVNTTYHWEVTPYSGDVAGEMTESFPMVIGEVFPVPYSESFGTAAGIRSGYKILDANKDGSTWAYNEGKGNVFYHYNAKNNANDWLITPPIAMQKGNLYKFSFTAAAILTEKFRVAFGEEQTAEAMTTEIVPVTTITGDYYAIPTEYHGTVRLEKDGTFYFGIQALSDADNSDLFIDDIAVTMVPGTAPAKVENFAVTPGEKGALNARLSFTLPTKTIGGQDLDGISSVQIYRNGTKIHTMTDVARGQQCEYTDQSMTDGKQIYAVTVSNSNGEGEENAVTQYVGLDAPGAVRNLSVVEDLNEPGTMIISWEHPVVGQNGGYVDPEGLTYYQLIAGGTDKAMGTGITTYREKVDISKGQLVEAYVVYAENKIGSGRNFRKTASNYAGPALPLPLNESFADMTMKSGWWVPTVVNGEVGDAFWDLAGSNTRFAAQDADGGLFYFETAAVGYSCRARSPKVDIRKAVNPTLVFYAYLTGTKDRLDVEVSMDYGDWEVVKPIVMSDASVGWHRFEIPLSDYKEGSFVQVGFHGYSVETNVQITAIDNISVRDLVDEDLAVTALTAPNKLKTGETGTFVATVKNWGTSDVASSDYTVELWKNDRLAASVQAGSVSKDRTITATLTDVPTIDDTENTVYYVKVNYAADRNKDNDTSEKQAVYITMPLYPAVKNVEGVSTEGGVSLSWTEPNAADMPATQETDNFESYNDFIISNIGNWKTVDRDGGVPITLSLTGAPLDYDNAGKPAAFQVFNSVAIGIPFQAWDAFSGEKMLVSLANSRPTETGVAPQNDDWLISPELNGKEQTVSFYAKGAGKGQEPTFEVRYSTTNADVEAFADENLVGQETALGVSEWEEFRFDLPEGAKYFAIRNVSLSKMALMIDDVTYTPAGALAEEISLTGYNLYRDGKKLNGELLGESYYLDKDVTVNNTYVYKVTAVYDKGESVYSDECSVLYIGIGLDGEQIRAVRVSAADGNICVRGAEGLPIRVYTLTGMLQVRVTGEIETRISVRQGVYVVVVDGKSVKISVF